MNKLISTIILAAFAATCSFGVAAGSHDSGKETTTSSSSAEKKDNKTGTGKSAEEMKSTRDVTGHEKMPNTERTGEYKDQEVMNKKPYTEKK